MMQTFQVGHGLTCSIDHYGHLNSKGFVNAIGRLRSLGFIDYPDRGTIVAKPVLFLEGR